MSGTASAHSFELSAGQKAWLARHVTLHRVLWLLALASFFIAWNRGLALLYGVFSLVLALLILSWVMPLFQLRGVRVERLSGTQLVAGERGRLRYRIAAPGQRFQLRLQEQLPFAANQVDSGVFLPVLNGVQQLAMEVDCQQRGCFQLDRVSLTSAYPFGVVSSGRLLVTTPQQVLVWPRRYDIKQLPLPVQAQSRMVGAVSFPRHGGQDEFASVREYRHGDPLRRVHWAASARQGQLVVREYDHTEHPSLLLVLDCRPEFVVGDGARTTFERAVEMTAAIMRYATRQGWQSCLYADIADGPLQLTLPGYCTDLAFLLDQLALLSSDGQLDYPSVVAAAQRRFPQPSVLVTFSLAGQPDDPAVLPGKTRLSMQLDEQSFKAAVVAGRMRGPQPEADGYSYLIGAGETWTDLFR
ncbi:MAG: DUF58 domain-containing protein [Alcanivoracaceae bacterium]|nr:DUF58 domain-containing protein [Alcanivoracaceae bacterium]